MKRSASNITLNTGGTNVQEEQAFKQTLNELNRFEQGFNNSFSAIPSDLYAQPIMGMEHTNDINLLLASFNGVYGPGAPSISSQHHHSSSQMPPPSSSSMAAPAAVDMRYSHQNPQQSNDFLNSPHSAQSSLFHSTASGDMLLSGRFSSPTELFANEYSQTQNSQNFSSLYDSRSDQQSSFMDFNDLQTMNEYANSNAMVSPGSNISTVTNGSTNNMRSTFASSLPTDSSIVNSNSITSLQVWSEFISAIHGVPIVEINEEHIPATIVGGKSVTKRRRTPLLTSMIVDIKKLKSWVEILIAMVTHKNPVMAHAESFLNVCSMHHLNIDLDELKATVESGENPSFQNSKWSAEVVLLVNDLEQENGLESDNMSIKEIKKENSSKKKKTGEAIKHSYSEKQVPNIAHHVNIEFVPLRAKVVSSNKKNCKLRYKVFYDSWLVFQMDSKKTFAINCGKTARKEQKRKLGISDEIDTPGSQGLYRVNSLGNLSYTSITSDELKQEQETFNDEDLTDMQTVQNGSNFFISPSHGSLNGGYLVFIHVKKPKIVIESPPQQYVVLFGDARAEIAQIDQNAFFVRAPPCKTAGKVSVKIQNGDITISDLEIYFEYTASTALDHKRKIQENAMLIEEPIIKKVRMNSSIAENSSAISSEGDHTVYRKEWAIIIGISNYESRAMLSQHEHCINYATNLMNILTKEYGFNVCTLFNEQATRERILKLFDSISENVHKDDCVLIYFVGLSLFKKYSNNHVEGFIAPYDADPENIGNTCISQESFVNSFRCFPAKHICYILDTCYTGRLFKIRTSKDDTQYFKTWPNYAHSRAVQVLCASSEITDASLIANGLFSKELVNALKTMRFKIKSHIIGNNIQFSTVDQLGQLIQERVIKESNGKQIPKFGRLEIGDGQFMLISKSGSEKSPNIDFERIISLICVYEEYLQNMNLGDIHTRESLLQLMKMKFFQNSKFFLDIISNLMTKQTLELRSDYYSHMRLNLVEVLNTAKHSYLAVYSPIEEWMTYKTYQLADVNALLLKKNPEAIIMRIFIIEKNYQNREQLLNIIKVMKYHNRSGIHVRVVFKDDIEKRKEIPANFSIIDSRLCHVLYQENDYPKSVLIFNRKTVADIYYSFWVYVFNASISFDEYMTGYHPDLKSASDEKVKRSTIDMSDELVMTTLTDPLLSFDSEENMKSVQHHLNPMLNGFKNILSSLIPVSPFPNNAQLSEGACNILFDKLHKLCGCYENVLTSFFSEGKIEVHSRFFDRYRVRLHDLEHTVEKCYRGCVPVHSWLPYQSQDSSSPYFTFESVNEIIDMNKRLLSKKSDMIIERIFVFHKQMFKSASSSTEVDGQHSQFYANDLQIEKIQQTLESHEKNNIKVYIVILESLEEVKKIPGTFCIIDNCLVGGTEMRTEEVPIRLHISDTSTISSSMTTKTETNIYYVNKLSANMNDVRSKQLLWDELRAKSMTCAEFNMFIKT
jgi:hypothetical protein